MFFYSNSGSGKDFNYADLSKINANTAYLNHLSNFFYLRFIEKHSDKFQEKSQATKELEICERKMKFWKARLTNKEHVGREYARMKKEWSST